MPRAGLDRAGVVRLGLAVVDERGAEALTLANVAAAAGVAVPSLYKHVASLADLRDEVATASVRDLTACIRAAVAQQSGGRAVRAFAHAVRGFAHDRPGRYDVAQAAAPLGSALAEAAGETVAVAAAALRGLDLPPEQDVDAVRALRAAVHGFVTLEALGGFGLSDSVDASFSAMVEVLVTGFSARAAR